MRSIISIYILFQLVFPLILSAQSTYFNNIYKSQTGEWSAAISIVETVDNYLIGGTTGTPPDEYWHQITLSVLDKTGIRIDEKLIGDTLSEYYLADKALIITNDGLITFAGTRRTYPQKFNHDEIILIKLNNEFDTLWSKYYGEKVLPFDSSFVSRQIIETSNNNLVIVGTLTPEINYRHQIYLMKTDINGNFMWDKSILYPNTIYSLFGYSVIETPDKGFAIGAYRYKPGFSYTVEPMVYKVDSLGNEEWSMDVGGPYFDSQTLLCNTNDGNIIAALCYADSMQGSDDAFRKINVKKLDLEGNIIWDKKYGSSNPRNFFGNIRALNDGGYILSGTYSTAPGSLTPWLSGWMLKINEAGDSLWFRLYNYNYSDQYDENHFNDIIPTSDNGFAACGEFFGLSTNYTQHAWIVKVDSMGCDTPGCATGVQVFDIPAGDQQELWVWPNPAHDRLIVTLPSFPAQGEITGGLKNLHLYLYNSQGVKVEEITVPEHVESLEMDVSEYANGLYYLQMVEGSRIIGAGKFVKK